ncbi:MAG: hypothetical protein KDK91_29450 [Gammaproteobacteria bacterium]|nr:hypothetical protein [Gammaproteobacteria bacterium]
MIIDDVLYSNAIVIEQDILEQIGQRQVEAGDIHLPASLANLSRANLIAPRHLLLAI